jgi:N-acetyl-gamma-glutamyl-phosphate reductase
MTLQTLRAVVLGGSGYTGAEVLRLLFNHPVFRVVAVTGEKNAGARLADVFPHLGSDIALVKMGDVNFQDVDVAFSCLPHAAGQAMMASLPESCVIIDLSADFRLRDVATYEHWYGSHLAKDLQKRAVYGLSEWYEKDIQAARLIANPGCYPTASLLPLIPLLRQRLIETDIIIDAKSGISGAGRKESLALLAAERIENVSAYGLGHHRHYPEILQECNVAASEGVRLTFTPHLMPMVRGMLATIYVRGGDLVSIQKTLEETYRSAPFVHVTHQAEHLATKYVSGTNMCRLGAFAGYHQGDAILVSVIDNLGKGAAGQAVQNANIRFGLDPELGLKTLAAYP